MAHGHDLLGIGVNDDGGQQIAVIGVIVQGIINRLFKFSHLRGEIYKFLRPPINLTTLEVHDAPTQGLVGRRLIGRSDRCGDIEAAGVGLVTILREHELAHGFCHIFGVNSVGVAARLHIKLLFFCASGFCGSDEPVLLHALNDVQLSASGSLRVADRVVGGRGLGQARQHGGFSNGDVFEGFAEIGFTSCCKTVGTIAQKNLVHVDFKNLVFAQQVFQLESQQDFVNFAGKGFFRS